MAYKRFTPQEILLALQIEIPASAYQRGHFYWQCMFCDDKSEHLNINIEKGKWRCNKCSEGGSLMQLYGRLHEPPLRNYKDILHCLEEDLRINVSESEKAALSRHIVTKQDSCDLADVQKRDRVYHALLDCCALSRTHATALRKRGLTDAAILKNGYKTAPQKNLQELVQRIKTATGLTELDGVPGFYLSKRGLWSIKRPYKGIMIPFRDGSGMIQSIQIRVDDNNSSTAKKIGKYMWWQSGYIDEAIGCKGTRTESFIHHIGQPSPTVILTEGGLKADVAACLMDKPQFSFIAIAGVNATKKLQKELKSYKQAGTRHVLFAFDMDMYKNIEVMKAVKTAIIIAQGEKLTVGILNWNKEKGIDDFLLTQRADKTCIIREFPPFI